MWESLEVDPDADGIPVENNLRLPGQYDEAFASVLLFQQGPYYNHHRWYDPGNGRYLQPEPLLQPRGPASTGSNDPLNKVPAELRAAIMRHVSGPGFVTAQAREGRGAPAYSYAFNNPITFFDPDGNAGTRDQFCRETNQCSSDFCARNPGLCSDPPPGPGPGPGGGGGGRSCDPKDQGIVPRPDCLGRAFGAYALCMAWYKNHDACVIIAATVYANCAGWGPPN